MNKVKKIIMLVSSTILTNMTYTPYIFSMESKHVDLGELTLNDVPSESRADERSFFKYLDSLKDGINNTIIDEAKSKYKEDKRTAPIPKVMTAINYLKTAKVATQEFSKELAMSREQLSVHKEEIQKTKKEKAKVEQEKELQEKAFQQATGMSKEEIKDFIESLQKSLSGFSDALFLMKFSGDTNPDFSTLLEKIAEQATASREVKKLYDADKKIEKLEVYLQLPKEAIDTKPLSEKFQTNKSNLIKDIEKKISQMKDSLTSVKVNFENIEKADGFLSLKEEHQKKFRQYRYGKNEEKDGAGIIKEAEQYAEIFKNTKNGIEYFKKFIDFLKQNYSTPLEFKEKLEGFKFLNNNLIQNVFDKTIGGQDEKSETTLLINKSGLSFYRYLDIQLKDPNIKGNLKSYIEELLEEIDQMRIRAFELIHEVEEDVKFVKSGDRTKEPSLIQDGLPSLLETVNAYEVAEQENALLKSLTRFVLPHRDKWVDYGKIKEFKDDNHQETEKIFTHTTDFSEKLQSLSISRKDIYESKKSKILSEIIQSNLFEDEKKNDEIKTKEELEKEWSEANGLQKKNGAKVRMEKHLAINAKKLFKNLEKKNQSLEKFFKLFDEKSSIKSEREEKNAKADRYNKQPGLAEKDKLKIEEAPPLRLENMELTGIIQEFIKTHPQKTFDNFWQEQTLEANKGDKIPEFSSKLMHNDSKETFKTICLGIFTWIKNDTPEKRALTHLFEKVIHAHDQHTNFMQKMGAVNDAFKALESKLPKYDLKQQAVENKVNQLKALLSEKPGDYLTSDPESRATLYAYNFLMFSHDKLKPLKPEMDIWGTASPQEVTRLLKALQDAHTAYQTARNAIVAINKEAKDRGADAKLFGGFDEEIIQ